MSEAKTKQRKLVKQVFEKTSFQLVWVLILGCVFIFIGLPIQRAFLVLWVKGSDAYFHQGIRVLKGKPVKFSDGQLVPNIPDAISGFATFMVIVLGLSFLLILFLNFYERRQKRKLVYPQ
jgi:ABC-type phosphate transport system permease subunit